MSEEGKRLAEAAVAMVGTPFRLGGQNTTGGLDCVGLVIASLEAAGFRTEPVPAYSLRQHDIGAFIALAGKIGFRELTETSIVEDGDVLLLRPSPAQFHLAIGLAAKGIIHAHAGLRRVTITPAPLVWPILRRWRLRSTGDLNWQL